MIETSGLDVCYGKKQILFGVSLQIEKGARLLLAGPNGAGKSTLLRAIAGMIPAASGSVRYRGKDITATSTYTRIRGGMGYLLQSGNIVPSLTVRENLMLGAWPHDREDSEAILIDLLDIFPFLAGKLHKRGGLLSGGERQALAICMVLMKKPDLLLLDEPSAGLSPKAAERILASVAHAQDALGIDTVCMVEHRLREGLSWATKLIVLAGGRTVHIGTSPELYIKKPHKLDQFFFSRK